MPDRVSPGARFSGAKPLGIEVGALRIDLLALNGLPYPAEFKLRSSLVLAGDPAYLSFKQRVLQGQIRRALAKGRTFIATLPESTLAVVEHGQKMKTEAATQCRALLVAARAALGAAGSKHSSVRALSGYRSVEKERELWDGYFEKYYAATARARGAIASGPCSEAAVQLMVSYVSDRKAAPGYGNHSAGIAMDFATTEGKVTYSASMSQKGGWKKTPFHEWLEKHAGEFHFKPYVKEPWHWEFKP